MSQVWEILAEKGRGVLKIDADASVLEAVERMVEANVGSLLVAESGDVTGIVCEPTDRARGHLAG
jgi:predicted transcriptional regulator